LKERSTTSEVETRSTSEVVLHLRDVKAHLGGVLPCVIEAMKVERT